MFNVTRTQKTVWFIGLLPSVGVISQCMFILNSDKDIKHKLYHVSGEWGLRFLYLSLLITPIYDITKYVKIIQVRQTFGLLSFWYTLIHIFTYIKYTLIKDGRDLNGFWIQLNDRYYLKYGVIAWICMLLLALTSNDYSKMEVFGYKYWKMLHRLVYLVGIFAVYHLMTRNWDRLSRGKSSVEGATSAPIIMSVLLSYRILKYLYKIQKTKID